MYESNKDTTFEDDIPPLLFSFYKSLTAEGFTSSQAFTFTHTYFEQVMRTMIHDLHQSRTRPPEGQTQGDEETWGNPVYDPDEEDDEDE